jgi:hypothetical protein
MLKKIGAILGDLKKTEAYADAIARRMFHVDAYRWCDPEQLHKIIAALEYTRNKMNGEGPTESIARKVKKIQRRNRESSNKRRSAAERKVFEMGSNASQKRQDRHAIALFSIRERGKVF